MNERVRAAPRMSVNKLGEYMVASASRRRGLIREQKRPRDFVVARYAEVYAAVREFLVSGGVDIAILERAVTRLENTSSTTEWQEQDRQLSIEAIDSFAELSEGLDLSGYVAMPADSDPPQLSLSGVSVSVRPDLILQAARPDGSSAFGAIKLCITKNSTLGDEAGLYVATTVHQYLTDCLRPAGFSEANACMVIDLFARAIHVAPRSFRRRRADIEAACEEIARAWPVL